MSDADVTEDGKGAPHGSCLACGYDRPWVLWHVDAKNEPTTGLCARCERGARDSRGDPAVVHPSDSLAESQAGLNGPSGSPNSPLEPAEDGKGDAAGIVEELREEWEALGLVPYHGIGTSLLLYGEAGWYAHLGKAAIAKIRGLLNRSAAEVERLTREIENWEDIARAQNIARDSAEALVERLTGERDEARATIASQEFRKECADTPLMRDVMAEREAARAEVGRLSGLAWNAIRANYESAGESIIDKASLWNALAELEAALREDGEAG